MKSYRMILAECMNNRKKEVKTSALRRISEVIGSSAVIDCFVTNMVIVSADPVSVTSIVTATRNALSSEYLFGLLTKGMSPAMTKKFVALLERQNDLTNRMVGKVHGTTPAIRHHLIPIMMKIDGNKLSSTHGALKVIFNTKNKLSLIEKAKKDTAMLRPFIHTVLLSFIEEAGYLEYCTPEATKYRKKNAFVVRVKPHEHDINYMLTKPLELLEQSKISIDYRQSVSSVLQGIESVINMPYTLDEEFNKIMLAVVDTPIFEQIMKGKSLDEHSTRAKIEQSRVYIKEGVRFWEEIEKTNFYSKYVVDFRGRITQLGGISSVASKPCKAMLRSGIAAPLGKHGYKHLLIAMAGAMGLDKETFTKRYNYGLANLERWVTTGDMLLSNPVEAFKSLLDADDPFAAASYCLELYRCMMDKNYCSNVFVGYDATSSAVQLVGLIMGNRTLTEASNIRCGVDTEDKIHDSYMLLADIMDAAAPKFRNDENKDIVDMWTGFETKTKRAFAKPLLMTRLYGSRFNTWRDRSRETAIEKGIIDPLDSELVRRFGVVMAQLFQFAFDNEEGFNCLRAYEKFAKSIAKAYAAKGMPTIWTLQDVTHYTGQKITSKYLKYEGEMYYSYIGGKKLVSRTYGLELLDDMESELRLKEVKELDKAKLGSAISPNFIHSHDALLLYSTVLKMNTTMRLTHDCFGSVPGKAEDMLEALNESCVELFGDNKLRQLETWRDECYKHTEVMVPMPEHYREEGISSDEISAAKYKFS